MGWVLGWIICGQRAVNDDSVVEATPTEKCGSSSSSSNNTSSIAPFLGLFPITRDKSAVDKDYCSNNRNRFGSLESDVESLSSSDHSNRSIPSASLSKEKRRPCNSSSLDMSSGSDNSYESTDDTSTSIKVRLKLYGSNLLEMAIGDNEDGKGKKGLTDEDDSSIQNGQKIVGIFKFNRKTAWLLFFAIITIGAFFCLYEREKDAVGDTIRLLEYGVITDRHR